MNQGGYFGAYQSGFQTLPKGAYEMMTAPTQQLASTITDLAGTAAGAYKGFQAQKATDKAFKQGAAAQYKGLESLSQATGVPVNPELANQYLNIGNMSQQEQAMFNQSLGQEAQNLMARYNISQAQARAAQAQGGQGLNQAIIGFNEPFMALPQNGQVELTAGNNLLPSIQNQPSVPVYEGAYDNFGRMMPRVGTIRR